MRWERVRFSVVEEEEEVVLLVDWKRRVGLVKREAGNGERGCDL
jgi:hypothetical protein